jgi:type I restriction enzyme M protein
MQKTLDNENIEETIPPGKIKCIVTGKIRNNTPEEKVRQEVARSLLEEYHYDKKNMDVEFVIEMGRAKKKADIVIFDDGRTTHTQENVNIIIETKKEDIKPSNKENGIGQLESYLAASPNAKFGLWIGSERIAIQILEKKGKRETVQISDIPPSGEFLTPKPTRGSLVPATNLKYVLKRIHNYIYANQGLQKDKAFEELLKLIFIKVYDEQYNSSLQFYFLPGEETPQVRERLLKVFENVKKRFCYIFNGEETIELNDKILAYSVSELQRFSLVETDTDVKGEAYEEIVGPNLRGDRGEFFTPRNVCKMVIDMLLYLFPEKELTNPGAINILDPAVGTGGFLIAAIHKIKKSLADEGFKYDKLRDLTKEIAETNFFGIDFNPFLAKVSQMNMVMNGDGSANITHANSLEHPSSWSDDVLNKLFNKEIKEYRGINNFRNYLRKLEKPEDIDHVLSKFDVVVTNPPFGTKALIDDSEILCQYEITNFETSSSRTSLPPEQLFLERCLQFLKHGGVLGIVLPNSILSNPGLSWLRKWILEKSSIISSIELATETFEPYTGTQTSILILKKKRKNEARKDYDIFMSIPEKVGHDRRGNPIFKTTLDGKIEIDSTGKPIIDDHLPIVSDIFKKWIREKGYR